MYYQTNGMTYFHAGNTNGEGFIFRNTAHCDIVTIQDNGNISFISSLSVNGTISCLGYILHHNSYLVILGIYGMEQ